VILQAKKFSNNLTEDASELLEKIGTL